MHGLVLLDGEGQILRPALLWNDQRKSVQCDEIRRRVGKSRLIEITGNDALTGFTAPKILWVQTKEPMVWQRTRHILLLKEYVTYRLTGDFATDRAEGAGTLFFDIKKRNWSEEVITALDISPSYLPKTFEGTDVTSWLTAKAAELSGLRPGIPIVGGGGEQSAQAVGVGAVEPGIVALTLGTSGVVFATTDEPFIEPEGRLHSFCRAIPDRWHLMGVMLLAGGSLRWYRDTFAPDLDFGQLVGPVKNINEGSGGLLFLPYLTGERTPHSDPLALGAFIELNVRYTRDHLTGSLLEGVAYGIRENFETMSAGLKDIQQVRISGGGARSQLGRQILADILCVELVSVNITERAAFGAAILAAVGVGDWPNVVSACESIVAINGVDKPRPDSSGQYDEMYQLYKDLYPATKEISHRLVGKTVS